MTFLVWPCHFLKCFLWILVYLAIEMFVTDPFQVIGSVPLNSLLTIVILSFEHCYLQVFYFGVPDRIPLIPSIPHTATWVTNGSPIGSPGQSWAGATGRERSWKSLRKSVNLWPIFTGEHLSGHRYFLGPKSWRIPKRCCFKNMLCHGSHQYIHIYIIIYIYINIHPLC